MAVAQERPRGKSLRRIAGLLVFLLVLWCGAWAAGWWGANWAVDQAEGLVSPNARCTERAVSGFPLTIQLDCERASVEEPFVGIAANVNGLVAAVALYYPLRVDATAVGPLEVLLPGAGGRLVATWSHAQSSTDAWPFGEPGIRRFSADVEGLFLATEGSSRLPLDGLKVARGSLVVRAGRTPDSLTLLLSADGMDLQQIAGRPLPEMSIRAIATAEGAGSTITANLQEQFFTWLASGGPVLVEEFRVEVGGVKITATGPMRVGADGLLSGTVQLGFAGLDQLPALFEALSPGWGQRAAEVTATLNAFTREGEVEGERLRQVEGKLINGQLIIGFIPLPVTIPSIFSLASLFS